MNTFKRFKNNDKSNANFYFSCLNITIPTNPYYHFSGFGAMNKSQSQCYRCGVFCFPAEILIPRKRQRNRRSRFRHSCTAQNCYNRDRNPGGMWPQFHNFNTPIKYTAILTAVKKTSFSYICLKRRLWVLVRIASREK